MSLEASCSFLQRSIDLISHLVRDELLELWNATA